VTDNVKRVQGTGAAVLVHSIADRVANVREALAAGAAGVIPKSFPTTTVMAAIATVARGDVLNNLEWATAIDADTDFAKAQLGRRERDVLHLYASGLPLKAVAEQLGIANSTAREYLDRIRVKYVEVGRPAPTKVDLLRRAVEDGILPGLDSDTGNGRA
jgi:DNA-binding NarL/FixJ family response regulator